MSPLSTRIAPPPAAGLALLALVAMGGLARATPPAAAAAALQATDDGGALALARDRSLRADALVDSLKRALLPGHLTDPTPEADPAFGLDALRADYADLQRQAASYRATLGDRHPTLVGTEQLMAETRTRLADATRRALAAAQRVAAQSHEAARQVATRIAEPVAASGDDDATGSIAPAAADPAPAEEAPTLRPRATSDPAALPAAALPPKPAAALPDAAPLPKPAAAQQAAPATSGRTVSHRFSGLLAALAAGVLALLLAVGAVLRLIRYRPTPRAAPRRIEPALRGASTATAPAVPHVSDEPAPARDAVPVLATLPLPRSPAAADVVALFAREPQGALATASAGLHDALTGPGRTDAQARRTVLVTGQGPAEDLDAAALALALAAAAAGTRAVILEGRASGRLRRSLVPDGTAPILVAAGGAERTLYRVDAGTLTVAVLPTDPGEAEAAVAAAARPETPRFRGLDGIDLVILVGDPSDLLAAAADVVLVVVPASASASPEAVGEAAAIAHRAGRTCATVMLERPAAPAAAKARVVARRRIGSDAAPISAARLGLRGSLEPARRRAGR